MKHYIICGGRQLHGEVTVAGFKNAALPLLYASLLAGDVSVFEGIPKIRDVFLTLEILHRMGARIRFSDQRTVLIDTRHVRPCLSPDDCVSGLRASTYLMGAELARFGKSRVALPGGCDLGKRPLDLHRLAFETLGAEVRVEGGAIVAEATALKGATIRFPKVSVGATVNAILAACGADGETVIENAAREPHIAELCRYLSLCGASIRGGGESCIRVSGGRPLHGAACRILPDMIEAGTFLCAVGATGGELVLHNVVPAHLSAVTDAFSEMGMQIEAGEDTLFAARRGSLAPLSVTARPYPGFPTDMHPQTAAMCCVADGVSHIREEVFPARFQYAEQLARFGARVHAGEGSICIEPSRLVGATVTAPDLRAGAAVTVAALAATGESVIRGAEILERGYDSLVEKLRGLGAVIGEK